MEFSTEFVALRDKMADGQDAAFTSERNATVCGRTAALFSRFSIETERKMFGVVSLGQKSTAQEFRLVFAVPELTEAALADWWGYACGTVSELVKPTATHEFSIVSLILVSQNIAKPVQKQLRRLADEQKFAGGELGWAMVRAAAIDLASRKLYFSMMGDPLKKILRPFL